MIRQPCASCVTVTLRWWPSTVLELELDEEDPPPFELALTELWDDEAPRPELELLLDDPAPSSRMRDSITRPSAV